MTPKSQHTPGPWRIKGPFGPVSVEIGVEGRSVARVTDRKYVNAATGHRHDTVGLPEGLADARLIAAAPELLAALREVYDYATDGNVWPSKLAHWVDTTGELLERVAKAEQGDA